MAQKRTLSNWRKIFRSRAATSTSESSTGEPSQVPVPVNSGQIFAGAHHFNIDNSNFTSIQTQYVTVTNPSGITDTSGGPLGGLESQLSDIFSPAVVALYGPKEDELAKFVRNHLKWFGSVIIINGKSAEDLTEAMVKKFKTPESLVADTILVIENMESRLKISDYLPPWFNVPVLITGTQMEITKGEYARHSFHLPMIQNRQNGSSLKIA
ncbi:hypothetical protein D9757_010871 [Collybiopsis confluens]|uniref:Uncharacterized protein n=1 Tax=Collybiopsis confluens TaxID=2823264 RepID=A0A8H5M2E1_9AGAR|nr:hypothetical protein D9757_010871 [Collybiopsis confluens]